MKNRLGKLTALLLSVLLLCSVLSVCVQAAEDPAPVVLSRRVIVYGDGSWDEIILTEESVTRAVKTSSKQRTHYNDNDEPVWRVKLTGTFTYNGVTSSCTNAYMTPTFYKSGWSVYSEDTSHSGNTATTNTLLGLNVLGVVMPMAAVNLSLSCDKDGNLS